MGLKDSPQKEKVCSAEEGSKMAKRAEADSMSSVNQKFC
jgi:hypothetical protein